MLELVFSIGLFSIVLLMVATMFGAANKVSQKNYETEKAVDLAVSDIVMEKNLEGTKEVQITFRLPNGDLRHIQVEEIETQGLKRFREK